MKAHITLTLIDLAHLRRQTKAHCCFVRYLLLKIWLTPLFLALRFVRYLLLKF